MLIIGIHLINECSYNVINSVKNINKYRKTLLQLDVELVQVSVSEVFSS